MKRLLEKLTRTTAATAVVVITLVAAVGTWRLGAGGLVVACVSAFGVFWFGVALWWFGDKAWDEIGRAIMVAVVLAVVVGVPQYLVDQSEKDRDAQAEAARREAEFRLSLALQDDLSGADLRRRNLAGARLWYKRLSNADLRGANLANAELVGADLENADLAGADLSGADMRRANLEGADLRGANLQQANLARSNMTRSTFARANLAKADLSLSALVSSCLAHADLRGVDLAGSDLAGAVLTSADLRGTWFETDLKPAKVGHAGLKNARSDHETTWPLDFSRQNDALAGRADARPLNVPPLRRPREAVQARVLAVADGDTLLIETPDERFPSPGRLRLIGIDAPHLSTPQGRLARSFLAETVLDRLVHVSSSPDDATDAWGRRLVYMWISRERSLNEEILDRGLVRRTASEHGTFDGLWAAELRAKQRGVGLWRSCPARDFNQSVAGR